MLLNIFNSIKSRLELVYNKKFLLKNMLPMII